MEFREDYWDNPGLKLEFIRFLNQIHNLDLSRWDRLGYWDSRYRPFSFFDGATLAANVCVYSMDMTVAGRPARVAQISAVGTRPEYRRRGLSSELTDRAINWAKREHEFFYLFADDDAIPLYEKKGFQRVVEYKARMVTGGTDARPGSTRLDMERADHRDRVYRLAAARTPVSDQLGVRNAKLLMFWCLYGLRDCVHYIPALDVVVLYRRRDTLVTVYDIVGTAIPAFADIYPYIAAPHDSAAEFLFMPDKLNLSSYDLIAVPENMAHVRGGFPLAAERFIFPVTAQA